VKFKEAGREAKLTQEQLAEKAGTKKVIFQKLRMRKEIYNFQL
jgi:DNA-binding XRE family transcriptional regulator